MGQTAAATGKQIPIWIHDECYQRSWPRGMRFGTRLYNIFKGAITLDGNNVIDLDVNWLQR